MWSSVEWSDKLVDMLESRRTFVVHQWQFAARATETSECESNETRKRIDSQIRLEHELFACVAECADRLDKQIDAAE